MKTSLLLTSILISCMMMQGCDKDKELEEFKHIKGEWTFDGRSSWGVTIKFQSTERHKLSFTKNEYIFVNAATSTVTKGKFTIRPASDTHDYAEFVFEPTLPYESRDQWEITSTSADTLILGDGRADGPLTYLIKEK